MLLLSKEKEGKERCITLFLKEEKREKNKNEIKISLVNRKEKALGKSKNKALEKDRKRRGTYIFNLRGRR